MYAVPPYMINMCMFINAKLKQEASIVLEKILPLLSHYGVVHVGGSYNLDTMAWKDLDIAVLTEDLSSETVFGILREIGTLLFPTELLLKDYSYVTSKHGNNGRYIQCKQAHVDGMIWDKIDIIVSDNKEHIQEQIDKNIYWKEVIKESDKESIIAIKEHFWTHPLYRKDIVSVDIYRAVALEGVRTVEEFREWLEREKGVRV